MLATSEAGRLWMAMGDVRARVKILEREMRDKAKGGVPLWGHMLAMALISAASALGFIRPEVALAILRLLGKAVTG